MGVHHFELIEEGIAFAVRKMEIDFLAPAKIDDLLVVETRVAEMTPVRLVLDQTILREGTVLTKAQVLVVAIKTSGGPVRLPAGLRTRLQGES
jgi:acyl-CoA thioester hydrolase